MRKALASDQEPSGFGDIWKPDSQDLEDERTIFKARDLICQNNFGIAVMEMDPESVTRMEKGLEPLIPKDKEWVSRTPGYIKNLEYIFRTKPELLGQSSVPG